MASEPKVSVVMPCYNDGRYLSESIASVRAQTYDNVEVIIVDDGSEDRKTLSILKQLANEPNLRIVYTQHVGPSGARNRGIEEANGTFILPLDSDDTISPTYIAKAVAAFAASPDVGAVYCRADLFGAQTGKWDLPDYTFETMLLDNIVFVTTLFKKEDWENVGGFNPNMKAGMEDYDFWLSILSLGKRIEQIPEVLFHYRIKENSRTAVFQQDCEQVKQTYRQIFENHKDFYREHADEVIPRLRDALIEQLFLRRMYEERAAVLERIKQIPVLGKLLTAVYRLLRKRGTKAS